MLLDSVKLAACSASNLAVFFWHVGHVKYSCWAPGKGNAKSASHSPYVFFAQKKGESSTIMYLKGRFAKVHCSEMNKTIYSHLRDSFATILRSLDWFEGKSTGKPSFYHQISCFPVDFPLIQFRDRVLIRKNMENNVSYFCNNDENHLKSHIIFG